jgi:hypothetical protein
MEYDLIAQAQIERPVGNHHDSVRLPTVVAPPGRDLVANGCPVWTSRHATRARACIGARGADTVRVFRNRNDLVIEDAFDVLAPVGFSGVGRHRGSRISWTFAECRCLGAFIDESAHSTPRDQILIGPNLRDRLCGTPRQCKHSNDCASHRPILALLEPAWLSRHRLAEVLFAMRAARQWRPCPWGRSSAAEAFLAERATLVAQETTGDREQCSDPDQPLYSFDEGSDRHGLRLYSKVRRGAA